MSYLTFLLIFLVVPIGILAATQPRPLAGRGGGRSVWSIPLLALVAFAYTTPWDNYLVFREVWWYGPDRVLGTIGYVPYEEYAFFLLQPVFTGLFLYHLLARQPQPERLAGRRVQLAGSLIYLAVTVAGVALLFSGWARGLYMGLILAWAGPVLFGLWAYGGRLVWALRRAFFVGVLVPTVYFWIADRIAIGLGIWSISDRYSFGFDPLGLPIEEATFFLVTNLLVGQGTLLFLHGDRLPSPFPFNRTSVPERAA